MMLADIISVTLTWAVLGTLSLLGLLLAVGNLVSEIRGGHTNKSYGLAVFLLLLMLILSAATVPVAYLTIRATIHQTAVEEKR